MEKFRLKEKIIRIGSIVVAAGVLGLADSGIAKARTIEHRDGGRLLASVSEQNSIENRLVVEPAPTSQPQTTPEARSEKSLFAEKPSIELDFTKIETEDLEQYFNIQNGSDDKWDASYNNTLGVPQKSNVEVKDGKLILSAQKVDRQVDGFDYTGARIDTEGTNLEFTTGKVVARLKFQSKNGLWPGFWMLSSNKKYISPELGYDANEIDIMEHYFDDAQVESTIHTNATVEAQAKNPNADAYATFTHAFEDKDLTQFHDYGVELLPTSITFTIDNVVIGTIVRPEDFDETFHLIFDVEVGGEYAGSRGIDITDPVGMQVESIQYFPVSS